MKAKTTLVLCLVAVAVMSSLFAVTVIDDDQETSVLFVQSASHGKYEDGILSLYGITDTTYFADRPLRIAGHISNEDFSSIWNGNGDDSFRKDPPNAALSILGERQDSIVVEIITPPMINGNELSYGISVIEGNLPSAFDSCTLFFDAFNTAVNSQITDIITVNLER